MASFVFPFRITWWYLRELFRLLRGWLHGEFQPGLKYFCDFMKNFKFIAFIPLKFFFLRGHLVSKKATSLRMLTLPFQPRLTFHFDYMDVLRIFQPLPRLRILDRFQKPGFRARIFSPGWNLLHIISTFISRGFLSELGLKFLPVHPDAIECIKRQSKNFLENITWSELAKQLTRSIHANRPINFPSHIKHCW